MAYRANVLSVMIASPSDVVEQRDDVREIIATWNFVNAYARSLILMPVGWETHSAPDLNGRAQSIINDRLVDDCDLLVGIFWTKLGTPTGDFESGTVEEISRHVEAGKPAMIYFSDAPVAPQSIDPVEYDRVKSFKAWCYDAGLVANFSNSDDFRQQFAKQIQIQINGHPYLQGLMANVPRDDDAEEKPAEISEPAQELLMAAAEDRSGHIMMMSNLGGMIIQTNGLTFGEAGSARSSAKWESAVLELVKIGYIVGRGGKGQVFQVTESGYQRADKLKGSKVD